jgi:hypothetical protein
VQQAWGIPIVFRAAKSATRCRMARVATGPVRGYALFEGGRLGAVFFTAGVKTARGIGVGSTLESLIKAYGARRLLFWPDPNSKTGIYVYTRATYLGDARALRFDPDPRTKQLTQIGMGGLNRGLSNSTGRC